MSNKRCRLTVGEIYSLYYHDKSRWTVVKLEKINQDNVMEILKFSYVNKNEFKETIFVFQAENVEIRPFDCWVLE